MRLFDDPTELQRPKPSSCETCGKATEALMIVPVVTGIGERWLCSVCQLKYGPIR